MERHLPYLRHERVSELIRKELGELILRELEFSPYGGPPEGRDTPIVTIIAVEVTKKIDYAQVHVSVIPSFAKTSAVAKAMADKSEGGPSSKEIEKKVLDKLNSHRRQLQNLLLRKINIRPMPEISFEIDRGTTKAAEIEKIFIEEERNKV